MKNKQKMSIFFIEKYTNLFQLKFLNKRINESL
jgi:hypothetical protein